MKTAIRLSRFLPLIILVSFVFHGCGSSSSTFPLAGSVSGSVEDAKTLLSLPDAKVTIGSASATTDSFGGFAFPNLPAGSYRMSVVKTGYITYTTTINVTAGETDLDEVFIYPANYAGDVEGTVINGMNNTPLSGVKVTIGSTSTTTDGKGYYNFALVPPDLDEVTAEKTGFTPASSTFTVKPDSTVTKNLTMYPDSGSKDTGSATTGSVGGATKDKEASTALGGVLVSVTSVSTISDVAGIYLLNQAPAGTQIIRASFNGYQPDKNTVTISPGKLSNQDMTLTPHKTLLRKGPYLLLAKDNSSMTVKWQTNYTPHSSTIEWGYTAAYGNGPIKVTENSDSRDEHIFSYDIKGLSAGTKVYYRVKTDAETRTGNFLTPPEESADHVVFYGHGDTRSQPEEHMIILEGIRRDIATDETRRHTFILNGGDLVSRGLNESYWDGEYFNPAYASMQKFYSEIPELSVIGNHECYLHEPGHPCYFDRKNGGKLLKKYWPYSFFPVSDRFYYSFEYGPVEIIAIDTWMHPDYTPGTGQYDFIKEKLEKSKKPWKIILLHTPIWDCKKPDDKMIKYLTPLFKKEGVKLVVQGHQHYYAHLEVDGIHYVILGGGGAPLSKTTPYSAKAKPYIKKTDEAYSYGRFEIDKNRLTLEVKKPDGSSIETIQIEK